MYDGAIVIFLVTSKPLLTTHVRPTDNPKNPLSIASATAFGEKQAARAPTNPIRPVKKAACNSN
jgi:hypothetical protein